jgi:L-malate glycosyltransferase
MKVLHIIDTLWLGGAQTVTRDYFERLADNHEVFLYALRTTHPLIKVDHKNVYIDQSSLRYNFFPLLRIRKIVRENQIDVLHCHLLRSHFFGFLLKKLFFGKINLVIHEHGDLFDKRRLSSFILNVIKRKVDVFICCSNAVKERLMLKIGISNDQVCVIYNFVDTEKFNRDKVTWSINAERGKIGIRENSFVFGFVARLVKRKGWSELLNVARQYKDTEASFIIAGDGTDREEILGIIDEFKLNNVFYVGHVNEMTWLYSLLDCIIVPSYYEPMGLVVLEAQSMEVPVIASNVEGLREIVAADENALLVEPNNYKALMAVTKKIIADASFSAGLKKGGLLNARKYSVVSYSEKLEQLYQEIIQ